MLSELKVENYRGFRSYHMTGLTRVNLLVGKNNCGKSALLECVQFLASGGDPMILIDAAGRRGEVAASGREGRVLIDFSHFFSGHEIGEGARFVLTARNDLRPLAVEAVPLGDVEHEESTLFEEARETRAAFALRIEGWRPDSRAGRPIVLSEEGALLVDPRFPLRRYFGDARREGPPIAFISPDSAEPASLGAMWNQVLRDKQEGAVRKAMGILEPDLEDIVFQTGDTFYQSFARSHAGRAGVLVSFAGSQRRVPLGSMGDGMRRMLALAISLNHAKGGYLLIDEIDTGLHYSVMAKMWELVVRTAMDGDTQAFATTHSADCVRGLAVLCKQSPELQSEVSVHKIERDLEQDVPFSGADVLKAVEQDIEIR